MSSSVLSVMVNEKGIHSCKTVLIKTGVAIRVEARTHGEVGMMEGVRIDSQEHSLTRIRYEVQM